MPLPKTPAEEATKDRERRNSFFDEGAYPKGDRFINPARKRTAYEFSEWARTQPTHHIAEGSYLDMLEREERLMGESSYPAGHPRRKAAMAGISSGAWTGPTERDAPETGADALINSVTQGQQPVRANRFADTCANCNQNVGPGEGRRERRPEGWVTVHHPRCPPGARNDLAD